MRVALVTLLIAALTGLSACGNEPDKPPVDTVPKPADGWIEYPIADQGVTFKHPAAWRITPGDPPLLATMSSGLATISVWRYPRQEPLPESLEELTVAKDALVAAAQARDSTFEVIKAKGTRAAHRPAVVIIADETVAGQPRRVRSTHIYTNASEFVIDAFAPADQYAQIEESIIVELVRTFEFSDPA